ncbi:MAG: hypothetical protein LBD96_08610 [Treponema sp.]|nr:hypothetical protein [Treponema sp.]
MIKNKILNHLKHEAVPKLQFLEQLPWFWWKNLAFAGFSKSLFQNRARLAHSQLVLEQAQLP